mgnify:CR=1 FL=1
MITIRRSEERGHANHGWLDSHHTFSFAGYYDPRFMGFGPLRVINEDRVDAGRGFGTHPHQNMEIISYVVHGALAHQDSTGSGGVVHPGEVQVMSAGRGVRHSETNGSQAEPVHFLQIWIEPSETGTEPNYAERFFERTLGATLLVSPDGREESLRIRQDADLYRVLLSPGAAETLTLRKDRAWVQVVSGTVTVDGTALRAGDGAAITDTRSLELSSDAEAEALVFDL